MPRTSVPYDTEVVVQREIYLDGKNLCRVNGVAVTVGILRRLGLQLINIHGQHDSAALFDENYHLTFLDSFAADAPLLEQYRAQFSVMQSLQREMAHLRMDESEKLRRTETLRYQINEIERADLKPDEDTQLEARRRLLQNAEKLSDGLRDAAACLDGGDEAQGAAALLTQAERDLAHSARFDESLQPLHDTIADLMYQAQDAAEQLRDRLYRLSYSATSWSSLRSASTCCTACAGNTARTARPFWTTLPGQKRSWRRSSSPMSACSSWKSRPLRRKSRRGKRRFACANAEKRPQRP